MIELEKDSRFLLVFISVAVISITLILLDQFIPSDEDAVYNGIDVKMYLSQSDERKSAFDFKFVDNSYEVFNKKEFRSEYKYAYLWVELYNIEDLDKNIILLNKSRNYYTELLKPERLCAVTLFRCGDIVPMSESPYKHDKAAFPITIPAEEKVSVVIEYHSPAGVVVDPEITDTSDMFNRFAIERSSAGIICGSFCILLVINLISIIIVSWRTFYPLVLFITSVFFFYLRQSRILLFLIDPLVYPDWLFQLSIAFNIEALILLILTLLKDHLKLWQRIFLLITSIIVLALAVLGFFVYPFVVADLLNLLSLILLPIAGIALRDVIKKRTWGVLFIALSFIPWVIMVLIDIFSSFMSITPVSIESMQAFGMIASMFLLSISLHNLTFTNFNHRINDLSGELDAAKNEFTKQMSSVMEFRKSAIHQLKYKVREPLNSIQSLISILANEYALPEVSSICRILSFETVKLKQIVDKEIDGPMTVYTIEDEKVLENLPVRSWINSCICIFDFNPVHASPTALILRASGYEVIVVSDQYQALSLINSGKADILVIDPTFTGEASFSLCSLIRSEFNMFEVPILMITDYYADFLMKKGYGSGVNDFLTTPFDSSELSARIQSLVKLKNLAKHNHDLAKSEKEKNTFLYFLTHNINTPLTLMLNQINELSEYSMDESLAAIYDDLQAAGREINEIVQNVLISFRLSDGRHTVRLSRIDLGEVVRTVTADLRGKADDKNQQLIIDIEKGSLFVIADHSSLRGIIYNLVDNGLKFSPDYGIVNIRVSIGDSIFVRVDDSGPGIPEHEQRCLFERFQRLSPQPTAGESSTGLGLYVAYELSRMNGGDLFYESGHPGACFVFTLPAAKEAS